MARLSLSPRGDSPDESREVADASFLQGPLSLRFHAAESLFGESAARIKRCHGEALMASTDASRHVVVLLASDSPGQQVHLAVFRELWSLARWLMASPALLRVALWITEKPAEDVWQEALSEWPQHPAKRASAEKALLAPRLGEWEK